MFDCMCVCMYMVYMLSACGGQKEVADRYPETGVTDVCKPPSDAVIWT